MRILPLCFLLLITAAHNASAQQALQLDTSNVHILSSAQLDTLMKQKPACLQGYFSNQKGPLTRIDSAGVEHTDSTFTVEQMKIMSDGFLINGWLYLPLGNEKCPLIILTNGGGDGSRPIKSLSDWIAPVLAHCGIAAFVHDKRGTGESEGDYVKTTYNDYIADAGNCAIFLSKHRRVDPTKIGVMGGSEGGRVAVIAASRYKVFSFVISLAGTVVSTEEDRMYATMGGFRDMGYSDTLLDSVRPLWIRSFAAWASMKPADHERVNKEIFEARKRFDRNILPFTKQEMDSIPQFSFVLPTWYSMPNDYLTELGHFNKRWLAIFGAVDKVVPTEASIRNIIRYMNISGNKNYSIAVLPRCGHAPVDVETKRMVRIDNLVLNWLISFL